MLIIAGRAAERHFERQPLTRSQKSAFLGLEALLGAAWCFAFWGRGWLFIAMLLLTAFFTWGSRGIALELPGFRPEADADEEEDELDDDAIDESGRLLFTCHDLPLPRLLPPQFLGCPTKSFRPGSARCSLVPA